MGRLARRRLVALGLALALGALPALPAEAEARLPDPLALRETLRAGEFDALEARLEAFRRAGDRRALSEALRAFEWAEETRALERWVEARPSSGFARVALAWRHVGRAWEARGSGFAATVDRGERRSARERARQALRLAGRALDRDRSLVDAHALRIQAARLAGEPALAARAFREGLAVDPAHGELWSLFMWSRQRRWGGSSTELEELARAARQHADANPRLAELRALPDADRARDLANADRYERALQLYDRALSQGEVGWVYSARGWARYHLEQYAAAVADLDRALSLDPHSPLGHHRRAHALFRAGRYDEALDEAALAKRLNPSRAHYTAYHRWLESRVPELKRWEAFKEDPTLAEGLRYGLGFLYAQSVQTLGVVLVGVLGWGAWRHLRGRRGAAAEREPVSAEPAPGAAREPAHATTPIGRPVRLLLRVAIWPVALLQVSTYAHRWEELAVLDRWIHIPVTAVAFLGVLGFSLGRPLLARDLWRIWAWLFPIWNVAFQVLVHDLRLDDWPIWGYWHFLFLPVYASLLLYGYRSPGLWERGAPRSIRRATA